MHFEWTISAGQLATVCTLLGVFLRLNRLLDFFTIEHEYLMQDMADRKGTKLDDLPTRRAIKRPKILGIL